MNGGAPVSRERQRRRCSSERRGGVQAQSGKRTPGKSRQFRAGSDAGGHRSCSRPSTGQVGGTVADGEGGAAMAVVSGAGSANQQPADALDGARRVAGPERNAPAHDPAGSLRTLRAADMRRLQRTRLETATTRWSRSLLGLWWRRPCSLERPAAVDGARDWAAGMENDLGGALSTAQEHAGRGGVSRQPRVTKDLEIR